MSMRDLSQPEWSPCMYLPAGLPPLLPAEYGCPVAVGVHIVHAHALHHRKTVALRAAAGGRSAVLILVASSAVLVGLVVVLLLMMSNF